MADLTDKSISELEIRSLEICRNCDKFKTNDCARLEYCPISKFNWSGISPCSEYAPNADTDECLQALTMLKLISEPLRD